VAQLSDLDERARSILRDIADVFEGESSFGDGAGFWVNGRLVASQFEPGGMELRLTRAVIREQRERLRSLAAVQLRASASDWVIVRYGDEDGLSLMRELALMAVDAHRPRPGEELRPPPTPAEVHRRRRFH
jgi:hypothetical protein